jgi:hypothetical protein
LLNKEVRPTSTILLQQGSKPFENVLSDVIGVTHLKMMSESIMKKKNSILKLPTKE